MLLFPKRSRYNEYNKSPLLAVSVLYFGPQVHTGARPIHGKTGGTSHLMNRTAVNLICGATLTLVLGACATTEGPATPPTDPVLTPAPEPVTEPVPVQYGNFTRDQLTDIILNELGGQRGELQHAARNYLALARETGDTGIIARAAEFAAAAGHGEATIELASLWLERQPDQIDPHLMLGYQYIEQGELLRGSDHLASALMFGGRADFTSVSARSHTLSRQQHTILRQTLEELLDRHPEEASLHYAVAQIQDQAGDSDSASATLDAAVSLFGDTPRARILRAQIFQNLGDHAEASRVLAGGVDRFPEHRLLRYNYAQTLVQTNELATARTQFNELMRRAPDDLETLYSLALLNLELNHLDEAQVQLQTLLDMRHRRDEARFYQGYRAELANAPVDEALYWYRQVQIGSAAFLAAQRQIMRIYAEHARFDDASDHSRDYIEQNADLAPAFATLEAEAMANAGHLERASRVLNQALHQHPDDVDLLFARTLLSDRLDDFAQVESDLRHILKLEPDSARALNHLGYSLTLHTDRYEEALDLIERAIAIAPDDPAIIDSLGWVQYKLGMHEEALDNLSRAYEAFPDDEVAAHLGEVLWVIGDREQAVEVWRGALEQRPDSEHIREAMERLIP